MLLSEIQRLTHERVMANNANLVPIIHDRKGDGKFFAAEQPFCKLSIAPLDGTEPVYCDSVMRSGFILANVYGINGHGANDITIEAEKFAALFPEGLQFNGITIPDAPNIRGTQNSEHKGWFYVSTLIYFEAH